MRLSSVCHAEAPDGCAQRRVDAVIAAGCASISGGAAAFVQKPYRASELVARLGALLGRDS
jgi:hypothetical protein